GKTHAKGHYDHLYNNQHSAFFDYTKDAGSGTPVESIQPVEGRGTVTIENGVIKSANKGVLSKGLQSTAHDVRIIMNNVEIINQGYNATAVDVPQATISHCSFHIDNPFIINRHGAEFYAVDLTAAHVASEVAYSEFYGVQGYWSFKGKHYSHH